MTLRDNSTWVMHVAERLTNNAWLGPVSPGVYRRIQPLLRLTDGSPNPNWRQQVSDHVSATSYRGGTIEYFNREFVGGLVTPGKFSFTAEEPSGSMPGVRFTIASAGDVAGMTGAYPNWWPQDGPNLTKAYNSAVLKYLKKVREVEVRMSGPTFLAELHKTISMIRHPAQGLSSLLRQYVRKVKRAKQLAPNAWKKELSGLYLETVFGWKPFLHDLQDAVEAYHKVLDNEKFENVSATGFAEVFKREGTDPFAGVPDAWCPPFMVHYKGWEVGMVKFRGQVGRKVNGKAWGDFSLFGFTGDEFIPTAWEILPWSFLIDYFTNIGDIITASVANTSSIRWTNRSDVVWQYLVLHAYLNASNPAINGDKVRDVKGEQNSTYLRKNYGRNAQSSFPLPPISFELPGRPAQWANMLALAVQVSLGVHPQRMRG